MTISRLLQVGTSEEQRLLLAARRDGPSSRLRQNVLISVGAVGLAVTQVSATSSAVGATLTNASEAAARVESGTALAASAGAPMAIAVLVKWVGLASLALLVGTGSGLAIGTAWAERDRSEPTTSAIERGASRSSTVEQATQAVAEARPVLPAAQAAATLPLPPPRAPSAPAMRSVRGSVGLNDAVAEEVRLVDDARLALRMGDGSKCLGALAERQRRFPNGVLSPEASLLRIEALNLAGQHSLAKDEGSRFLVQYPASPLSARVRTVLEQQ